MHGIKLKRILYMLTVTAVLFLGIFAFVSNLPKILNKNNILKYETIVFETNLQLKETVCRNYNIDTNFDFLGEIRKINNLNDNDGMLGKALLVPILISN